MPAMAKIASIAGSGIGALEVPYEGISELSPAVDPPPGEVLEPGFCQVSKVQVVARSAVLASEAVIFELDAQVRLSIVLCDCGQSTISSW
jgi:hypothetical protein